MELDIKLDTLMDNPKLQPLAQFTPSKVLTSGYGDHYIFFVGRDDVHGIMHYLLSNEDLEHDFNMYGYDDPVLNQDILNQLKNPNMLVQGTLDKSQASGVHEKQILEADETSDPNFLNDIAIGESATHQISHTKAGVCVGLSLAYEGSVNWSASGEGTGISLIPGVNSIPGFKNQNNTLTISANPIYINRLKARLAVEHQTALAQMKGTK